MVLSCEKQGGLSTFEKPAKYEVSTLNSTKEDGLPEGFLSQVNLDNITSMVSDSKGNIFMADNTRNAVKN
jgi:hypothetical protein